MRPLPSEPVESVSARTLKVGDTIRLEDDRFERIAYIGSEENKLITGGPRAVTATALQVRTYEGTEFSLHPGQIIGLKRGRQPWIFKRRLMALLPLLNRVIKSN
jgi:hypothetical protein